MTGTKKNRKSRVRQPKLEEPDPPPVIFGPPKRTKPLKDVTAMDFPRGFSAEDVATDVEW